MLGRADGRPLVFQSVAQSIAQCGYRRALVDLDYEEDAAAQVDANFVATGRGELVEVQATGEEGPFPRELLPDMVDLALVGLEEICRKQEEVLRAWLPLPW